MQMVQIIIDTQYFEKAGPFLDDFVVKTTDREKQKQESRSLRRRWRPTNRWWPCWSEKLDDFDELGNYCWLLAESTGRASQFIFSFFFALFLAFLTIQK